MVEDGGEYACVVENRAGRTVHSSRLNVYGLVTINIINMDKILTLRLISLTLG